MKLITHARPRGTILLIAILAMTVLGWDETPQTNEEDGSGSGIPIVGMPGIQRTTASIMATRALNRPQNFQQLRYEFELEGPDRTNLPQVPGATEAPQWPPADSKGPPQESGAPLLAPQSIGLTFDGATGPTETGAFPPDCMGAVGPSQFIVFINGRLRSFNRAGTTDDVLNVDPDVFFASVMTPPGAGEVSFTSDPNIRYDRLSGRWFLTIIDVILNGTTGALTRPNRILIAVSDGSIITMGTVWTFFQFQNDPTNFADFPSLGIDADALYVGTDQFTLAGSFVNTNGYVIRKSSILGAGPIIYTTFADLLISFAGPYAPRGVDNYDPTNTGPSAVGYFIGVDGLTFSRLTMRRISNPGGSPTISANVFITVSTTTSAIPVTHFGNTRGSNGRLDALDDRLFAAHIRNGRLWTAHSFRVSSTGVASTGVQARSGVRWYELNVPAGSGTPIIVQSGTIFDNAATLAAARQYWIPSVVVSGQGHAAIGYSAAGTPYYADAATSRRLVGDALGTTQTPNIYTASTSAYNPLSDPGSSSGRRWGDYSFTCVDPIDDMTIWTIQEYCNGANTYGVRVAQLKAPPPARPDSVGPAAVAPLPSVTVAVRGTSTSGSGFFDPGVGFPNRLNVSLSRVSGTGSITVNSIAYQNPTHFSLNLNTLAVSSLSTFRIVVTNPDGQKDSSGAILTIDPTLPIQLVSFTGSAVNGRSVVLDWTTLSEINNFGFEIQKSTEILGPFSSLPNVFIPGHGTTNVPQHYSYTEVNVSVGRWYYRLKQIDYDNTLHFSDPIRIDVLTNVVDNHMPTEFSLEQNYPNPFNPSTEIRYGLPAAAVVRLEIYNTLGQEVAVLQSGKEEPGFHSTVFEGRGFPSGIYFYRIHVRETEGAQPGVFVATKKLILVK